MVLLFTVQNGDSIAQSSCIGKPYPSPGCPNLHTQQTASAIALCGNGRLDGKEECDGGATNGQPTSDCSDKCKLRYCGDGYTQAGLGEQCEPIAQDYYAAGSGSELVIERRFTAEECGANYCTPPDCDEEGNCAGGCQIQQLPACVASSSATSAASSVASSTATSSTAAMQASSTAKSSTATTSTAVSSAAASPVAAVSSAATSRTVQSGLASLSSSAASSVQAAGVGLSVSLSGPLVFRRGQQVVYELTVRNNSNLLAKNVVANDYLINYGSLDSFILDASTGGSGVCVLTGISIRCSGFDLAAGELRTIQFSFLFVPSSSCQGSTKIQAYATVTSDLADTDLRDNETDLVSSTVNCFTSLNSSASSPVNSGTGSSGTSSALSSSGTIIPVINAGSSVSSMGISSSAQRSSLAGSGSTMSSAMPPVPAMPPALPVPSSNAVCGNGKEEPPEECDFGRENGSPGAVCDTTCHRLLPGPTSGVVDSYESTRILLLRISYGFLALLVPGYIFYTRKKWMRLFKDIEEDDLPVPHGKSIDDVPLDEIEMPWRKL
jgi:hypothetical protein